MTPRQVFPGWWPLDCDRCGLHRWRRHVVVGRGVVPADILIVGIGPGEVEDALGSPFLGPSGKLLQSALLDAVTEARRQLPRLFWTNLVACRPCNGSHEPNRDPTPDECLACRPRLVEVVTRVRPERVVFLGQVTAREGAAVCPDGVPMTHPAYILRVGGAATPAYVRLVRDLAGVIASVGA